MSRIVLLALTTAVFLSYATLHAHATTEQTPDTQATQQATQDVTEADVEKLTKDLENQLAEDLSKIAPAAGSATQPNTNGMSPEGLSLLGNPEKNFGAFGQE